MTERESGQESRPRCGSVWPADGPTCGSGGFFLDIHCSCSLAVSSLAGHMARVALWPRWVRGEAAMTMHALATRAAAPARQAGRQAPRRGVGGWVGGLTIHHDHTQERL